MSKKTYYQAKKNKNTDYAYKNVSHKSFTGARKAYLAVAALLIVAGTVTATVMSTPPTSAVAQGEEVYIARSAEQTTTVQTTTEATTAEPTTTEATTVAATAPPTTAAATTTAAPPTTTTTTTTTARPTTTTAAPTTRARAAGIRTYSSLNTISELTPRNDFELTYCGRPVNYSRVIRGTASAYSANCAGSRTATGRRVRPGYIAVDPRQIPFGTRLFVRSTDGNFIYGYASAQDTGGFVHWGNTVADLFFWTTDESLRFGRRNIEIFVLD